MRKLFPKEYWLSWLGAVALFAAIFPRAMFSAVENSPMYAWFCVVLSAISVVLFRVILFRIWVKRFYSDSFRVYAWFLGAQSFCHLVFVRWNASGWVCIGMAVLIWLWMGIAWLREKKRNKKS